MENNCNHPTCSGPCRRPVKEKKVYVLKRSAIKPKTIPAKEIQYGVECRSKLISRLDTVFSRYIRIMAADENGICICYTCPTTEHFTFMQNGHYISRKHIGLRFDVRNGHVQCMHCNEFLHGNLEVYKAALNKEHPGLPDMLEEQSRKVEHISNDELLQMLTDLKHKLKVVEMKLIQDTVEV